MARGRKKPRLIAGMIVGALAGLIGSWMMNQFHMLWSKATEAAQGRDGETLGQMENESVEHEPSEGTSQAQETRQESQEGASHVDEPATVKAAERITEQATGHGLTESQKQVAGPAMHYGFGAAMGALYGGLAELVPAIRIGHGSLAGALLWLAADEAAVPALRLAKPPTQHRPSVHLSALATHIVFGLTVETFRHLLRGTRLREHRSRTAPAITHNPHNPPPRPRLASARNGLRMVADLRQAAK